MLCVRVCVCVRAHVAPSDFSKAIAFTQKHQLSPTLSALQQCLDSALNPVWPLLPLSKTEDMHLHTVCVRATCSVMLLRTSRRLLWSWMLLG